MHIFFYSQEQEESGRVEYIPTYRPKDETREERKARKNLVKEDRRVNDIPYSVHYFFLGRKRK